MTPWEREHMTEDEWREEFEHYLRNPPDHRERHQRAVDWYEAQERAWRERMELEEATRG